ncbi:MAG: hypothetical protein K0Q92_3730, partial [Steroidobacteraceae bacterium]|nr:hypothetical protein [Steroidobacteraceae bacterium]
MRIGLIVTATCVLTGLVIGGCTRKEEPETAAPATPEVSANDFQAFVDSFIEARMKRDPYFAVQSGRHEFDGQMPDWSRAAIDDNITELRDFEAKLARLDALVLTEPRKFERDYLAWVIDREIFWLDSADQPFRLVSRSARSFDVPHE